MYIKCLAYCGVYNKYSINLNGYYHFYLLLSFLFIINITYFNSLLDEVYAASKIHLNLSSSSEKDFSLYLCRQHEEI